MMGLGSPFLAFAAGILSILSPCVLPIIPLVLSTATSESRLGPVALAGGLSLSFVTIGLFVATVGYSIGLSVDLFRYVAAAFIIVIGVVLLLPGLQARLAAASGPIANWTDRRFGSQHSAGLSAQFGVGVLLGVVWSPCVGPTLGAASLLAAQGQDLLQVAVTMFMFGIGTAFPLLLLGLISREAMLRWRYRLLSAGQIAKASLGILFVAIGVLVLSGFDRSIETDLVAASPQWLTDLATRL
jgi:cytochrome c-type biogenesis protein